MKIKLFTDAGLNQNEAEAYKYLLEDGELTPPQISDLLKISRQNSYAVLKALERLGLARVDRRHKKLCYVPGDPKILKGIIQNKRKMLETSEEQLVTSMTELLSFYNLAKDRPGISVFRGVEGIQTLYEDTLKKSPKEILLILSEKGKSSYLSAWIERNFRPRRIKSKIYLREIITSIEKHDPEELKKLLWEKRYIDMQEMPRDLDILIYDNNVTFISYKKREPLGFTIDDSLVYHAVRAMFETLWAIKG